MAAATAGGGVEAAMAWAAGVLSLSRRLLEGLVWMAATICGPPGMAAPPLAVDELSTLVRTAVAVAAVLKAADGTGESETGSAADGGEHNWLRAHLNVRTRLFDGRVCPSCSHH